VRNSASELGLIVETRRRSALDEPPAHSRFFLGVKACTSPRD